MKRQRITLGAVLEINLDDQYYCYAQILRNSNYVFFDFRSKNKLVDFSKLIDAPILFIVSVYDDVVKKGVWLKVGSMPIRPDLQTLPMKFIQDPINPEVFELYNPNTGEIKRTTRESVLGLECAAVWEADHVESRIKDYYEGKPNIWVKQLSLTE